MATIIRLEQFNVRCRHHANGIRFPHVYRVTGFAADEGRSRERLVPGNTVPVDPFYTLSKIGDHGIANAKYEPIKALDPELDKGSVIVRHHSNEQRAHGYLDCIGDYHPLPYHHSGQMVWQTKRGHLHTHPSSSFSRYSRASDRVRHEGTSRRLPRYWEDAHHIIHPDGRVTTDPSLMYPSDAEISG